MNDDGLGCFRGMANALTIEAIVVSPAIVLLGVF